MLSKLRTIDNYLWKWVIQILYILIWLMLACVILQVVNRMWIKNPTINWSEELARYTMIWLSYLAASIVFRRGSHLKMELLSTSFPSAKKYSSIFRLITSLLFSVVLIVGGFFMVTQLVSYGQKSPALMLPMWITYLAIPVGGLLNIVGAVTEFYENNTGSAGTKAGEGAPIS